MRIYAQRQAAERGVDLTGGRVVLLCYPRLLGFTFNPLSAYFCYRADGELALMIYEVRNTFGDIHAYVLPVKPGEFSAAGLRQQQDKLFYVSPFVEMAMRYRFRVLPPGEEVRVRILETDREGPLLSATFSGLRRSLTSAALLRAFFALPLVTLKIVGANDAPVVVGTAELAGSMTERADGASNENSGTLSTSGGVLIASSCLGECTDRSRSQRITISPIIPARPMRCPSSGL